MINLPSPCCHLKVKTQGFLPMRLGEGDEGVWEVNATGLTIVKRSRSSTTRYYRVVSIIYSPRRFQSEFIFHEFTTFARIHDFRTNSRFLYEFLRRVFTNSRLSHEFTTFARFHNSHDQINHSPSVEPVSQTNGLTTSRTLEHGILG